MDLELLEKTGLKEKEAKVYLALLKEGSCLANQLAKKTGILRASIYDYLEVLLEKGFVSYTVQSGKKFFQAVAPEKILELFEEKKERESQALKQVVLELSKFHKSTGKKARVEIFEGKEGIKTAFSRILREKPKEILSYGSSGGSFKLIPVFMQHWHEQRAAQSILLKIIYSDIPETRERLAKGSPLKHALVKVSRTKDITSSATAICRNTVTIFIFAIESPLAIAIESPEIAKSFKNNFSMLWKNSKSI